MCVWKADSVHRTRAIPHIKTYTKINQDRAAYFVLTSSNLSKAAWGSVTKEGKIYIRSHEAGVLFLPKFTHTGCRKVSEAGYLLGRDLVLPYDYPLTKYVKGADNPFYHQLQTW